MNTSTILLFVIGGVILFFFFGWVAVAALVIGIATEPLWDKMIK